MYLYMHTYTHTHICIHMFIYIYIHIPVHIYHPLRYLRCTSEEAAGLTHTHIYRYMYLYIYTYIYIHIHISHPRPGISGAHPRHPPRRPRRAHARALWLRHAPPPRAVRLTPSGISGSPSPPPVSQVHIRGIRRVGPAARTPALSGYDTLRLLELFGVPSLRDLPHPEETLLAKLPLSQMWPSVVPAVAPNTSRSTIGRMRLSTAQTAPAHNLRISVASMASAHSLVAIASRARAAVAEGAGAGGGGG